MMVVVVPDISQGSMHSLTNVPRCWLQLPSDQS